MVLVHGNIIPTKHVGERTDSLRSKNWILILKKIDLYSLLYYKSVDQESSLFLTMDSQTSSPVGPAA